MYFIFIERGMLIPQKGGTMGFISSSFYLDGLFVIKELLFEVKNCI